MNSCPIQKATGNLFVNNGLVVDAIGVFQNILSKYPSCPPAFAGLGTAFALKKNLEKALLSFSAGLEIDPQNVECLSRRAQVFQSLGQVDRAIQDLVRAREIDSTNLYVLESLGTLYAQEVPFFYLCKVFFCSNISFHPVILDSV